MIKPRSPRHTILATFATCAFAIAPLPTYGVTIERDRVTLEIRFAVATDDDVWRGKITATGTTVHNAYVWPRRPPSQADRSSFVIQRGGRARNVVVPSLFLTVNRADRAVIELKPEQGPIRIALDDVAIDRPERFLDGRVEVHRSGSSTRLTNTPLEEDFPAATRGPDGTVYVAYVAYQHGTPIEVDAVRSGEFDSLITKGHSDRIFLSRIADDRWHDPIPVTPPGVDVQRPTIAVDKKGDVWVTWSRNTDEQWDLYQRRYRPADESWTDTQRLTNREGADISVVSAVDSDGTVWWAWQSWRDGNFEILADSSNRSADEPLNLSQTAGNEWNPAIVADTKGSVYVAWDSYDAGNYDVVMRRITEGSAGSAIPIATTLRFEARVSLAVDEQDRVWIAHESAGVNWGKDYAFPEGSVTYLNQSEPLYLDRTVSVKCYAGGSLQQPAADVSTSWADRLHRSKSFPRIGVGGGGHVWLTFRMHPLPNGGGENWAGYITAYDGSKWSTAQTVPNSDGLIDNRPLLLPDDEHGAMMVHVSDRRLRGRGPNRNMELYATRFAADDSAGTCRLVDVGEPNVEVVRPIHADEASDVKRLRAHRVTVGDDEYRLWRGEFHRHTEYTSHRDQDGSLEDMFRYALDAVAFDWIGNGDHDNGGGREYDWWIIQKLTSLYHQRGTFTPIYSYERSNRYPNGHRNVIFARRGIRPLPRGDLTGTARTGTPDTKLLYRYLRHFDGMCASHTSGTDMGTDWRDNDPRVEPVVEIYQGRRHSYEHFGAPRTATPATHIGGYQPAGYVWNALARGVRFGFQSSSDHVSTHMSYAVVLVDQPTLRGILEAFKARRCYAATDNILLIVRSGDHLMGEEFSLPQRVTLDIEAVGTTPIARLDVIRDSAVVYSTAPNRAEVRLAWSDRNQVPNTTSYYYVRLVQSDGNLAWSSPVWVDYAP